MFIHFHYLLVQLFCGLYRNEWYLQSSMKKSGCEPRWLQLISLLQSANCQFANLEKGPIETVTSFERRNFLYRCKSRHIIRFAKRSGDKFLYLYNPTIFKSQKGVMKIVNLVLHFQLNHSKVTKWIKSLLLDLSC